jgi:hypothetical protein
MRGIGRCRGARATLTLALTMTFALGAPVLARAANPEPSVHPACDLFVPSVCLLPFPNDLFTVKADTATGRRLDLQLTAMPRNIALKPIDPTDMNRADGFSPGTPIVVRIPGLDTKQAFAATGAVPITDVARSFDPDQPIVVINAQTLKRQLIWAEIDANPTDPAQRTLIIRPAKNFPEGARMIVALRQMRRADGSIIQPNPDFKAVRDGLPSDKANVNGRRAHIEALFATLAKAGIARDDLYLAWDFTVASADSIAGRMLHIRDDAFAQLGDTNLADVHVAGKAPTAIVYPDTPDSQDTLCLPEVDVCVPDGIQNFSACGSDGCQEGESDVIVRRVEGRVLVPCYLSTPGCVEGGSFVFGLDGKPVQIPGNTMPAHFVCNIPRAILTQGPGRPTLYGHGLLGNATEVNSGSRMALGSEQDLTMCATDWSGMSSEDLPNAVSILADLSRFNTLADRTVQGMLNFLYLGRALIHPDGLAADPAFTVDGHRAINTSRLYYDGGSQGGIMGGSLTAVAPDFTRAALGVPGMNYSTLLQRSVDFDTYAQVMYQAYPKEIERQLILALVQLLWDRGEADGYAHHMTTNPYPNTPTHQVILDMAYGDHQVTNWATIVEARTIGAKLREPALDPDRIVEVQPFYGIPRITSWPASGSLFEVWDVGPLRTVGGQVKGTPPPPIDNVPNRAGVDPHGPDASEQVSARAQIGAFLQPNAISKLIEVCGDHPCYLDGWQGPGSGT